MCVIIVKILLLQYFENIGKLMLFLVPPKYYQNMPCAQACPTRNCWWGPGPPSCSCRTSTAPRRPSLSTRTPWVWASARLQATTSLSTSRQELPLPPQHQTRLFTAVLRIHDILVLIRFSGSMPTLTNRFGFGSCYFRQRPSRRQQKLIFKDKKSKRSHKTKGINVVLTIFAWW